MPSVSSYALSGARFPGSIQLQSVQRRVGEAIFLRSWQTPGLALGYFVSIPLLIVITTAIATTKIPELFRVNQGFWYMVSDARTDFAMFCCLVFLISVGGGSWSLDAGLAKHNRSGG